MKRKIYLPVIELEWSDCYSFNELLKDARSGGIKVPNGPGVYEVIGKDGVIFNNLKVKWAVTDWPNSVEEYLHKKYKEKHGKLPKYTKVT